jgi:DNA-binding Xre family transcriptional regulator
MFFESEVKMMAVSYKKLFHLLLDRNIKKGELRQMTGLSSSSMAKLAKDENMYIDVLAKICNALQCKGSDIMEIYPDEPENNATSGGAT